MVSNEIERAVSTWSLHRTLGRYAGAASAFGGGPFLRGEPTDRGISLTELISLVAAHEYAALHICHFHLESRDPAYLASIRTSLAEHDVELDMLLIDDGDLVGDDAEAQLAWYDAWLDAARVLGARRARIGAGRGEPSPESLDLSGQRLSELAARHPEVRVVTENWLELTPDAPSLLRVIQAAGPDVGVLIDLGNWSGDGKYRDLASIAPMAESCHAKCHFSAEGPDRADFRRSLQVLADAGYRGPMALIYDGPNNDEWAGLELEWEIVNSVFGA